KGGAAEGGIEPPSAALPRARFDRLRLWHLKQPPAGIFVAEKKGGLINSVTCAFFSATNIPAGGSPCQSSKNRRKLEDRVETNPWQCRRGGFDARPGGPSPPALFAVI
ncbi:MAG: hypothetical protein WBA92_07790, partial [Pseudorhodobacter sp.]